MVQVVDQLRGGHRGGDERGVRRRQRRSEVGLDQLDHGLLADIAHAVDEHGLARWRVHEGPESAAFRGERQAMRAAAAMARGHEHGRGLAPDADLLGAIHLPGRIERGHGHHQGARPAGEGERLAVVRCVERGVAIRRAEIPERLLEQQRVLAVLVVRRLAPARDEAATSEEALSGGVVGPGLEPQHGGPRIAHALDRVFQQGCRDAASARVRRDGNGIQPGDGAVGSPQQDRAAHDPRFAVRSIARHRHAGRRAAHQPAPASCGDAVTRERGIFQGDQRWQVVDRGRFQADRIGVCRAARRRSSRHAGTLGAAPTKSRQIQGPAHKDRMKTHGLAGAATHARQDQSPRCEKSSNSGNCRAASGSSG